jgi:hypothetical protein
MFKETPMFSVADIDEALKQNKFAEVVLLSWGFIEGSIDQMMLKAFKLDFRDPRAKYVRSRNIESKIKLLKELGLLTYPEYFTLMKFKEERNGIYHELLNKKFKIFGLQKKEVRDEIMSMAREAAHALMYAEQMMLWSPLGYNAGAEGMGKIRAKHNAHLVKKFNIKTPQGETP